MDESLEHLITSCHYSKNFWAEVMKWFVKQGIKISNLSDKDITAAKQYIYYCRRKSSLPSIRVIDSQIKKIYQLETIIAKSNNEVSAHNIKWGKYKEQ